MKSRRPQWVDYSLAELIRAAHDGEESFIKKSILEKPPTTSKPLGPAWRWLDTMDTFFCGLAPDSITIQTEEECEMALKLLCRNVSHSSWNRIIANLLLNRKKNRIFDNVLQLDIMQLFLLQVNMFSMRQKHLNLFVQILETIFIPISAIESMYLLHSFLSPIIIGIIGNTPKTILHNINLDARTCSGTHVLTRTKLF